MNVQVLDGEIVVSWPRHTYNQPESPQRRTAEAIKSAIMQQRQSPKFTIRKGKFQFHYRKSLYGYTDNDGVERISVNGEFYIDPEFYKSLGETIVVL